MSAIPPGLGGAERPAGTDDTEAPPVADAGAEATTTAAGAAGFVGGYLGEAASLAARVAEQVAAAGGAGAPDPSKPATAPAGTDISTVTADDIARLKADPKTALMGQTIENAQHAYGDLLAKGAHIYASTSEGNGAAPVLTLLSPKFDYTQPARVHTHYHGFNSTVADPVGHGAGATARIPEVWARDPQTVFVLPECGNVPRGDDTSPKKGFGADYATNWGNVSSVTRTTDDALAAAGIGRIGTRVVSAHSGGGAALASAIKAHPDGLGLKCDQLELEDCLYNDTAQAIGQWAKTDYGRSAGRVLYFQGTNTPGRDAVFAKTLGDHYKLVTVASQGPDRAPVIGGADGRPIPFPGGPRHQWKQDVHNRTVGQFMDQP